MQTSARNGTGNDRRSSDARRGRWVLVVLTWLLTAGPGWGQQQLPAHNRRHRLPRTFSARRDSTRVDSVRRGLGRLNEQKLLDSLRALTRRKTVVGRAASVLFDFRTRADESRGLDATLLNRQYDQHRYKVVRRIEITPLDAFGYDLDDLSRRPMRFWEQAGNAVHVITHRGAIRRALLFRTGEQLEPQALAETERLLRQTPHLLDARVLVDEATSSPDSVDIIVVTKDVFSYTVGASGTPGSPRLDLSLGDDNILGLGHQVALDYGRGYDRPQPYRLAGTYRVANLTRDFVQGQADFSSQYGLHKGGLGIARGFITPTTRWAGAARLDWIDQLVGADTVVGNQPRALPRLRYAVQDAWLGRSFGLRTYDFDRPNATRLVVAARLITTAYAQRAPEVPDIQNTSVLLASVGLSSRRYYKDRYLFGFGRTEDVPAGALIALTSGYQLGATFSRPYLGLRAAVGQYRPASGYFYGSAEFGSYRRGGQWEQGVFRPELLYFTRLLYLGSYRLRQFFWLRAEIGINRMPQELLGLNGTDGLRGFAAGTLRGQRRVVFNYESNLFTPLSFLGFRVAGIFFTDVAWLAPTTAASPFRYPPYAGVGVGLRLRNEFIAFRSIQLLLGYYPRRPPGEDLQALRAFENGRPYVSFRDFNLDQPGTSTF